MKIKVCGLTEVDNINRLINITQPDYIGLIFSEKSPRYVGESANSDTFREMQVTTRKTGVFVNASLLEVSLVIKAYGLDAVQLHGDESPEYCHKIRSRQVQVIKAFRLSGAFDFDHLKAYSFACDYFLFDAKGPRAGGNGVKFNWQLLDDYNLQIPFFLSGGIGPEDADAINQFNHPRLYGIDINSRFESSPGMKDVKRIHTFLQKLKNYTHANNQ